VKVGFRHADSRYPFFWESAQQPPARWHADGDGPVQYLADTPDGAWAEFLRHEEIVDAAELTGIERSLWAVQLPERIDDAEPVTVADPVGGLASYPACQNYATSRRVAGVTMLRAPSAALIPGAARGEVTDAGLREAPDRDGHVWVIFGRHPELCGWRAVDRGSPPARLLPLVRTLT
jgi:hypothetical protein